MIIVTGGAGFIGSNIVRGLNRRGRTDIVVVDDLERGEKHLALNALEFDDFVDYRDFAKDLESYAGARIDAILHQGACSDTMETNGRFMLETNYESSKRLLGFALGRCPFVYASSASVYGSGERGFREEAACEEPLNVYAFSKLLFDRHVRRVLRGAQSQIVGLRYFNVYGPQENHKGPMASVVFKFHGQAAEKRRLELFEGSDGFRRDFVFVDDVVDVNLFFLDHPQESGIFNVGTGKAESFLALARAYQAHAKGVEIVEIPFPAALKGRYQGFTQADLTRLRAVGYRKAFTGIDEGVAAYARVLSTTGGYHRQPARP